MEFHSLIKPLGITSYLLLLLAVLSGPRIIKLGFTWHKRIGVAAVVSATLHAVLVLYYQLFY